jgi:formiminotetrahydrofolate cyclodeaminase
MARIVAEADALRSTALGLAEADAAAFGAVAAAYQLPRSVDGRSEAIAAALAGAARPPAEVIRLALMLIPLAEGLLAGGNRNVITDVGAAAAAARAAAVTARLNIEVNLRGITDAALRDELAETAGACDAVVERADRVVAAARAEITR